MRFLISFLLLATAATVFSQNTNADFARRQIRYLLKEKIRLKDVPGAIEWFEQHPEQIGLFQQRPESQSVADRSGEVAVHDDEKAESEVHAAINPTDTNNIIVAAILQDVDNMTSPIDVPVYYTKNFGQSWLSSSIQFSPDGGFVAGGGDPVLAFDKNGKAYLSWLVLTLDLLGDGLKLTLYYSSSTSQGQTWSAPIQITFGTVPLDVLFGGNGSGALVDKQWMATDQSNSIFEGKLYTSYTRIEIIDSTNAVTKILCNTKPKNSNNFGASVQVHQSAYAFLQFSSIDVDGQGNVHVLFFGGNSDDDLALYHTISTNGGASFQPEVKISDVNFPGVATDGAINSIDGLAADRLYPCPHLRAGTVPGTLYATWTADGVQQQETEGYDVWFAKSTNNGQAWQTPLRVNPGGNPLAEQFYSALAVNANGTICLSYYDRSDDPEGTETHYVVTYSFDGGATFTSPAKATSVSSDFASIGDLNQGFGIGEYTQIVCTKHHAIPILADGRSNNGDIDIYAAVVPITGAVSGTGEVGTVTSAFSIIAPNPAKGQIELEIKLEKPSRLAVQVFGTDGKTVFAENEPIRRDPGIYPKKIALPKGIYLCRVQTDFGFKVRRIVVE